MKKNYINLVLAMLFTLTAFAQEAQKNFINYQGVARTADNELLVNETMVIGIDLKAGGAAEAPSYSENHSITTDANGVFSLKIGNGDSVSGAYNNFSWGDLATFVTVSINGTQVGTTEMTAVPYAISSGDGAQKADQVPYDNSVSGLAATNAQDAIDELVGGGAVDADADPTNELQLLSFDAASNELSLTNGGMVTIPSGGTDADADPTNELQMISFDAALNKITLTDGGEITIPSGGTDADADPTNEFQTLSFDATTNELSLTNGNAVTIPSGGTDADADPTNEIQDIELIGTELTITEGSTIDLSAIIPPGGTDDQNAAEVPFDNTGTTLAATDTQTALEELALSAEVDVTAQSGILLGDGTDVTGLEGTADGQVPKWDATTSTWLPGTDETGSGTGGAQKLDDLEDATTTDASSLYIGENAGGGTGGGNTAVGKDALSSNTIGSLNTANGWSALSSNTTGNENTATGSGALGRNTTGNFNTANGRGALFSNTTGTANTATGRSALASNTTGLGNNAYGSGALFSNTTGKSNTANGRSALESNTTGNDNTANGRAALFSNTTGDNNTANGRRALFSNITGNENTANGGNALYSNTTGNDNTANGREALFSNTTGNENTANGRDALYSNTTGNFNTAYGKDALRSNTTGGSNTANGTVALRSNITGIFNTANGTGALRSNTTGNGNSANGTNALINNTIGNDNTANGVGALSNNTTGNNNTALGATSQVPSATGSNQVRIGNTAITYVGVQVAWTVTSDARWKEKIQDLPYGLNMISLLRPVDYVRKNNAHQTHETGFIAQEVEKVLVQLGYKDQGILTKDDDGFMSLRYNDFIPVLTKAIQEQQEIINDQSEKISNLEERLIMLEAKIGNQLVVQE